MKRFGLRGVIFALVLVSSFLMASFAGAAPGFTESYGPQNWSKAGPGNTSITAASGPATGVTFHYDYYPSYVPSSTETWTFSTVATADGPASFDWAYSGFHAWFQVRVGLQAFADGPDGRVTTPLVSAGPASCCSGPPSGGFSYSGAATLTVHSNYAFGLIATGSNGDSNHTMRGDITLTNQAPSDVTPPVITPTVTGTLGTNGWYTSDVAVSWTVTDDGSAISSTSGCGPTTINADTADTTLTCSATSAGGTSSQSVTIKRDATAPTLAPTVAPNPVVLNGTATATANATDSMSGIASQGCAPVVTSSVGAQSVTCTATDNAGNSANVIANYTVIY